MGLHDRADSSPRADDPLHDGMGVLDTPMGGNDLKQAVRARCGGRRRQRPRRVGVTSADGRYAGRLEQCVRSDDAVGRQSDLMVPGMPRQKCRVAVSNAHFDILCQDTTEFALQVFDKFIRALADVAVAQWSADGLRMKIDVGHEQQPRARIKYPDSKSVRAYP